MLIKNENFLFTQPLLAGLIARNISSETEIETGGKENHSRTFPWDIRIHHAITRAPCHPRMSSRIRCEIRK